MWAKNACELLNNTCMKHSEREHWKGGSEVPSLWNLPAEVRVTAQVASDAIPERDRMRPARALPLTWRHWASHPGHSFKTDAWRKTVVGWFSCWFRPVTKEVFSAWKQSDAWLWIYLICSVEYRGCKPTFPSFLPLALLFSLSLSLSLLGRATLLTNREVNFESAPRKWYKKVILIAECNFQWRSKTLNSGVFAWSAVDGAIC